METEMAEMSDNQLFNLLLADIAMAAAIQTAAGKFNAPDDYEPGKIRDSWLAENTGEVLQRRVLALANAGVASLTGVDGEQLTRAAEKYGVPIDAALGESISQFFTDKREALLRYRR
jgi:phage repressor protein C with HTH and peptisase S24 domain